MSTPIETNTEELQEILQTVYNLPNAGGGSSAPDLVIRTSDEFYVWTIGSGWSADKVTYNPDEVTSVYEKLKAGKDVKVILTGKSNLDSWSPQFFINLHACMAAASNYGADTEQVMVYFIVDGSYFGESTKNTYHLKYIFNINRVDSAVELHEVFCRNLFV